VTSGDENPNDKDLQTFNALFPRGSYFGQFSPIGPYNHTDLHPSITVNPTRKISVNFDWINFWRTSRLDGVYNVAGTLIRTGNQSRARFVGRQYAVETSWKLDRHTTLTVNYSRFQVGKFLRDTPPPETQIILRRGRHINFNFFLRLIMIQEIWHYIFYSDLGSDFNNFAILAFRILLSLEMVRVHGLKKFGVGGEVVPNPLGLPPKLNDLIADFSDIVAPVLVAFGFLTRLAILPILAVTLTGYFVVHRRSALSVRDVPFMYSLSYLYIFLVGAGKFSADFYLSRIY
jgi:putative oxidoreductase